MSLEQDLKSELIAKKYLLRDESTSTSKPDFCVKIDGVEFWIEAKESLKPYVAKNWGMEDESIRFILDDLSMRKVVASGWASLLVMYKKDVGYFCADVYQLMFMEKHRINRKTSDKHVKGKWRIYLTELKKFDNVTQIIDFLPQHVKNIKNSFKTTECLYPELSDIAQLDMERPVYYKNFDFNSTR